MSSTDTTTMDPALTELRNAVRRTERAELRALMELQLAKRRQVYHEAERRTEIYDDFVSRERVYAEAEMSRARELDRARADRHEAHQAYRNYWLKRHDQAKDSFEERIQPEVEKQPLTARDVIP